MKSTEVLLVCSFAHVIQEGLVRVHGTCWICVRTLSSKLLPVLPVRDPLQTARFLDKLQEQ